ncbi:hypothetical protein FBU31_000957 [Coemansia sp. 'formosensis']|nr:hypothetical protein FBU31_000957 [Coemansia sp. 'formosensis']
MTGSNVYDPSQHHGHQGQHYAEGGGVAQHHGHPHHHHHHQQHMQQAQHGSYLPQAQGYAHHQHQQQQQQGEHLGHNFMGGASGALPSADIYGGFKFISPLYQGRLLPPQGMDPAQPTAAQSLYAPQSQYMHPQQQQQQQHQGSHPMPAHSVPSHQPAQVPSSRDQTSAAAAAAAAAAAVADLSSSFQLPQAPTQSIYPYYQESVPTWEATASSAEMSNGQSHSSPSTPTETLGFGQSQYTLHAVDHQPVYPVVSSNALPGAESAAAPVAAQTSAIAALSMVNPIASMPATDANARKNEGAAESGGEPDFSSMVAAAAAAVASNTAPRVEGGGGPSSAAAANGYLYGYPGASTSPNNVASSMFSMRQIGGGGGGPQSTMPESDAGESANAPVNRLAAVAAAAAASSSSSAMLVVAPKSYADAQHLSDAHGFIANAEQGADAHHLRRNMVQSPSFNVNVLSENAQFQNYS